MAFANYVLEMNIYNYYYGRFIANIKLFGIFCILECFGCVGKPKNGEEELETTEKSRMLSRKPQIGNVGYRWGKHTNCRLVGMFNYLKWQKSSQLSY